MSKWKEELEQDVAKFNKHKKKIYIAFIIFSIVCLLAILGIVCGPLIYMYILMHGGQH